MASVSLADQQLLKEDQEQAQPSKIPQIAKALRKESKGKRSRVIEGEPYRGVSQIGPNKYRAQICNSGKVRQQHMLKGL